MYKKLTKKLLDSQKGNSDHSPIWDVFNEETICSEVLNQALNKIPSKFKNKKLQEDDQNTTIASLLKDRTLSDAFWEQFFFSLRDIGCEKFLISGTLDTSKAITVKCAGDDLDINLEKLDQNVLTDYCNILHGQTAVPEIILFDEDKKVMMEQIKKKYEKSLKRKHVSDPDGKTSLLLMKESPEAKHLHDLQSKEAEFYVQQKLIDLGKAKNICMFVLRGLQTYENVGKHLQTFGIKLSKLR